MSTPNPNTRREATAIHLRGEIEKAEAQGVSREDMTLQLTLNDVNHLKRDRSLPVADISFVDGVMRFLGVKVLPGGVAASVLSHPDKP